MSKFLHTKKKIRGLCMSHKVTLVLSPFIILLCIYLLTIAYTSRNPLPAKKDREVANTKNNIVNDVTELNPVLTQGIIVPHLPIDIITAVKNNDHISIGGGRNSMGGQTASTRAVQLDMREYNKILSFSTEKKEITVQSGIRWRDIQDFIDPYNLSVTIMQTYSNFTVGGSLSVNVHGRYIGLGPIILSVKSFRIVLADGTLIEASPTKNQDIFYSAIGGMGGIGVITDVTLSLASNDNVERSQTLVTTENYGEFFKQNVRDNPDVLFHNGDMYPPSFTKISAVSWSKTEKEPTTVSRLIPRLHDYWKERTAWIVMSEWPGGLYIREHIIDPLIYRGEKPVHTRNYEASYDVAELEPESRAHSTYVLQEYFVPVERFDEWVPKMKKVFTDNKVNVINVSIRHALPDTGAKLAWAPTESFAFVVYYKQDTDEKAKEHVGNWTREMIDQVLSVGGTYYLPYQLHATNEQLHKAYPHLDEYFTIKKKYDPKNKFTNSLWDKYYKGDNSTTSTTKQSKLQGDDYVRPLANSYLSLPEWYIVYNADEYARTLRDGKPSLFAFSEANLRYWNQYKKVLNYSDNSQKSMDYITVLKVIGASFSLENSIKAVYENSMGRITEHLAGDVRVPEDDFAATVAEEYATLIYDLPWYDFSYASHIPQLWKLSSEGKNFSLAQTVRRVERKLYLTVELSIKAVYASLIEFATHQKFGTQDDIVCATVSYTQEQVHELLCAPHYQPFTRKLVETLEAQMNNKNFVIYDISGNKTIVYTFRKDVDVISPVEASSTLLLTYKEVSKIVNNTIIYKDRLTVESPVSFLPENFKRLKEASTTVDHFYDY